MSRPDRHPLPRDHWYVAAASAELGETPLARTIFATPVVLFRDAEGRPSALHDRCPHRGAPLSLGRLADGAIACPYHGWRFDGEGACRHIPSLQEDREIPKGIGVAALPCHEADGFVWVWPGEGPPVPAEPPGVPGFGENTWLQGGLDLACEAVAPIENNLDFCHPYFTHPETHPQYFMIQRLGFRPTRVQLRVTATGLVVENEAVRLVFDLPDRVIVASPQGPDRTIVIHHTPAAPGHCRQHWLVAMPGQGAPGQARWTDDPSAIFEQDRRILEAAQTRYLAEGEGFERSVEADAPTLMVRRIIDAAAAGRWPEERGRLRDRELVVRS